MTNTAFQSFLVRWFQLKKNRALLTQEQAMLKQALSQVFGLYLVQMGRICTDSILEGNRVRQHLLLDDRLPAHLPGGMQGVEADIDYLPLKKDSVDAVVLPHTLESVQDPYHLLRQIDQVLIADGHLVITGFNPLGCRVMKQRLTNREAFKQANLIRAHRLIDWLRLLGYDIEWLHYSSISCFAKQEHHRLSPWSSQLHQSKTHRAQSLGNVYCLLAKKSVMAPTPIGIKWRLRDWVGLKQPKPWVAAPNRKIHRFYHHKRSTAHEHATNK